MMHSPTWAEAAPSRLADSKPDNAAAAAVATAAAAGLMPVGTILSLSSPTAYPLP